MGRGCIPETLRRKGPLLSLALIAVAIVGLVAKIRDLDQRRRRRRDPPEEIPRSHQVLALEEEEPKILADLGLNK